MSAPISSFQSAPSMIRYSSTSIQASTYSCRPSKIVANAPTLLRIQKLRSRFLELVGDVPDPAAGMPARLEPRRNPDEASHEPNRPAEERRQQIEGRFDRHPRKERWERLVNRGEHGVHPADDAMTDGRPGGQTREDPHKEGLCADDVDLPNRAEGARSRPPPP